MTVPVVVPKRVIASTLRSVRWGGRCGKERVVLWLGYRTDAAVTVAQAYVPKQVAAMDIFRIPPAGMRSLMNTLRRKNLMVAAQVHTHPGEAFHSAADDYWAIVRHVGALSLVLPNFALHTTPASFLTDAAIFCLTPENVWAAIETGNVSYHLQVVP